VRRFNRNCIADGPAILWFHGLILSIYDTNKHYQFTVSSIQFQFFVILGAITKPTQITYEEYKQLKEIQGKTIDFD
jgi:hypothetical protein